jgi:hypothetical protein
MAEIERVICIAAQEYVLELTARRKEDIVTRTTQETT